MRMDRYDDKEKNVEEELPNYSRVNKNKDMYQDIYMNSSYVSIDDILEQPEKEINDEPDVKENIVFEEKNYSINDYLTKAHERIQPDEEKRNLDDDFLKNEDEISKLISSIDKKNDEEEFFGELIGNNSDTMIDGQLTKEEILETTSYEEYTFDTTSNSVQLSKIIGNETILNLQIEEEKNREGFQDVVKDKYSKKKKRNIAITFFIITLILLIMVIVLVVLPKL